MALLAKQEATEARMIDMMADTQLAAMHAKRVTVKVRDLQFVNKLTGLMPKSVDGEGTRSRSKKD